MNEFINNLLLRIGLIDYLEMDFNVSKEDFKNKLLKSTDTDHGLNLFEALGSSENDYVGLISENNFTLRRRRQLFDFSYGLIKFEGNYNQNNATTRLDLKICIKSILLILVSFFLIFGYGIAIGSLLLSQTDEKLVILPFLIIHGIFMFSIFFFMFKYQIKRSKKNIERDLFFMMYK
ncbi:MAG: hypothetical protein U0U67_06285 [Chitinophagales bacterium]